MVGIHNVVFADLSCNPRLVTSSSYLPSNYYLRYEILIKSRFKKEK